MSDNTSKNGIGDDYSEYLTQLHQQSTTDIEIIRNVVKDATGQTITSYNRVVSGEINEVYDVCLENSDRVIIRISDEGIETFQREHWAIEKCSAAGVPVPETLYIGALPDSKKAICIQRKINGKPLERGTVSYQTLPREELKGYIHQAGALLAKIHSVKTDGFGYLDAHGKGENNTFAEEMDGHRKYQEAFIDAAVRYDLDGKIMKNIFRYLDKMSRNMPDIKPVLNHNDYAPKHIVVRGSHIVGIIDFGQSVGHSPVNDFAKWVYWYDDIPLEWLKDGYTNKSVFDDSFDYLLQWIAVNNGLSALWWYVEKEYTEGVKNAFHRLERVVIIT